MAKDEDAAVNQLINVAVAEKLSALRTEQSLNTRVARADRPRALTLGGSGRAIPKRRGASPWDRRPRSTHHQPAGPDFASPWLTFFEPIH